MFLRPTRLGRSPALPQTRGNMGSFEQGRVDELRRTVREAVGNLRGIERAVIEEYYFDGMSMGRIAESEGVSVNRVVTSHRQALRQLREILAPFAARMFGIRAITSATCPICLASWREDAEAIIDGKTPDVTWGQIVTRIVRATGWQPKSPQVLIVHKRKHGAFQLERSPNDQTESAWGAWIEDEHLDGFEDESGENGEVDGPSIGGCVPDALVDGIADSGGVG